MSGPQKSLQKIIDKMESYIQDLKIEPEDYFLVTGVGLWVPEYDEFKMRLRERLGTSGFRVREWEDIQIGATIGVHTGPYPLGAGLLRQWKKGNVGFVFLGNNLSISVVFPVISI